MKNLIQFVIRKKKTAKDSLKLNVKAHEQITLPPHSMNVKIGEEF